MGEMWRVNRQYSEIHEKERKRPRARTVPYLSPTLWGDIILLFRELKLHGTMVALKCPKAQLTHTLSTIRSFSESVDLPSNLSPWW